jgi:hypothetical protein
MEAGLQKWLLGIATSIVVGLSMWWLTNHFLSRPELRVVDSQVSGCDPLVINVTTFNSGDKLAEKCSLRVELYRDDGGLFPSSYTDLKRLKRFDVASSSDVFFLPPHKQQEAAASYSLPKGYRCDLAAVMEGYTDIGLWLGVNVECEKASTKALLSRGVTISAPPNPSGAKQ